MTRTDIRLENLRLLVEEYETITALADAVNTSEKYLWQLLNSAPLPSGNKRQMGNKLAQRLEEGTGKPTGWIDQAHTDVSTTGKLNLSPQEAELIRRYRAVNDAHKRAIMAVARLQP